MNISDIGWNVIAPAYRIIRRNPISGFLLKKEKRALKLLLQHLGFMSKKSICDLGVGRGHSLDLIENTTHGKVAIDKSIVMVRHTREKYSDTKFLVGDVNNLPFINSSFDLILCIGLSEYIPKFDLLLQQISLVLKPEGFLIITSSPKNILTFFRVFNGHKLYTRNSPEVETHFKNHQFKIIDRKVTAIQLQYLLKYEGN